MLVVKQLTHINNQSTPAQILHALDNCVEETISIVNWAGFPNNPFVSFRIGYNRHKIYLKFNIVENNLRGLVTKDMGKVWTDSCVEFFLSPGCDKNYYNFEVNCIGTLYLAYGDSRFFRMKAESNILKSVARYSSLGTAPIQIILEKTEWEMLLIIAASALFCHQINDFGGKTMTGNFYKCGDEMVNLHYLSWNPVHTAKPDFHQASFFRKIYFEENEQLCV